MCSEILSDKGGIYFSAFLFFFLAKLSNFAIKLAQCSESDTVKAVSRPAAGTRQYERKVRAAQGAPLLKMEAIGDSRILQKKTTACAFSCAGKGEKVV